MNNSLDLGPTDHRESRLAEAKRFELTVRLGMSAATPIPTEEITSTPTEEIMSTNSKFDIRYVT